MISVSEAAARLKLSRTTVYDWVDKGILLAWRGTKRGLTIPAEQILGEGRVLDGLNDVVEAIGDAEIAWEYLSTETTFGGRIARPIDLLKDGQIDDVIGAAASYGTAIT
ncbi:helix-turn-helix domain-containing protein [Ruegeria sp. HKCCD8929]|uniref:helix-turn-helix domain-containing protein n=1 Tax=Ruegeria sp. HKCCD8929 TaxID=2683006 RepID=UPI0035303B4A